MDHGRCAKCPDLALARCSAGLRNERDNDKLQTRQRSRRRAHNEVEIRLILIAAVSVLFLFMGIRNSWDTVTYVALKRAPRSGDRVE